MLYYLKMYLVDNYTLLFTLLILFLFMLLSYRRKYDDTIEKNPGIYIMAVFLIALSIVDFTEYQYSLQDHFTMARKVVAVIGYSVRPIFGMVAVQALETVQWKKRMLWIPVIINTMVYCTAFFNKAAIWYTPDNKFHRGPLYVTVFLVALWYAALVLIKITELFKHGSRWQSLVVLCAILGLGGALIIDAFSDRNRLMFPVMAVSLSFYYAYLTRQEARVRELEQEIALNEQQNQLMMSQIQPHFLYNTLATAAYLCEENPELAEHTILQFSDYLRQNMKTIGNNEPVPFEQEIEHTEIYTEIEMLRFDNIEVNYELEDLDFLIPALSVQPMVENSIRHGIRSRDHGVVNVRSYRDGNEHVVEISDNGIGFDVEAAPKKDRPHIGLANVKKRIHGMVNGTMSVESVIGEGTKITIRIPDKGEEKA